MTISKRPTPQRAADRRNRESSTREALLRATVEQLDIGGETEIRLETILAEADCSPSSLYHHFGNLRGLLDEAEIVRFSRVLGERTQAFNMAVQEIKTREELIQFCTGMVEFLSSGEGPSARSRRVNALGATYKRPDFAKRMGEIHAESCDKLAAALRVPQLRGLIDESIDVYALAHWIQGIFFGRILIELGGDDALGTKWNELTKQAVLFTLFGSGYAADGQ